MALFKHKGGSLRTFKADGTEDKTLYYGEDLNKSCSSCGAKPNERCTTASGKLLGKVHSARSN